MRVWRKRDGATGAPYAPSHSSSPPPGESSSSPLLSSSTVMEVTTRVVASTLAGSCGAGGSSRAEAAARFAQNFFQWAARSVPSPSDWTMTSRMKSAMLVNVGQSKPRLSKYPRTSSAGPMYTISPLDSRKMVPSIWKMRGWGWWIVSTTTRVSARSRSSSMMLSARAASRDVVGSSRTRMSGSVASAMAMLRRFRSPDDSPVPCGYPTRESLTWPIRTSSSTSIARARTSAYDNRTSVSRSRYMMCSSGVRFGNKELSFTVTNPTLTDDDARDALSSTSSHSMSCTLPATFLPSRDLVFCTTRSSCVITLSSVVLPAPEGPIMAVISPPLM
mmetsp:Transcript_13051/g.37027  ORF Transcript_13051/g.37027 Transcript_13051/m.37027 type:complete len:332 (+) Transcript_13051:984-1979(+)